MMPLFCARYLVFIQALLGLWALASLLPHRRHVVRRRWLVSTVTMVTVSGVLALVLGVLVPSPRPFVSDGLKPLFPHSASNGFPSHHALLAAAVVASVALLDYQWALILGVLAVMVDWGRVACHVHHLQDVLGANAIVVLGAFLGIMMARRVRSVSRPHRRRVKPQEEERLRALV